MSKKIDFHLEEEETDEQIEEREKEDLFLQEQREKANKLLEEEREKARKLKEEEEKAKYEQLRILYTSPWSSGSYGGIRRLHDAARTAGLDVTYDQVKDFLASQKTYTLHHPQKVHFKRRKVRSYYKNYLWSADLADVSQFSRSNSGVHFLLVVVDVWTKFLYVEPLKSKHAEDVAEAFKKIFDSKHEYPTLIVTDKGKEFVNDQIDELFKEYNVHNYTTQNSVMKAANAERMVQIVKKKIWAFLTEQGGRKRYLDALPDLIKTYNATPSTTHGLRPDSVTDADNDIIEKRLYPESKEPIVFKFKVGDQVRIAEDRAAFHKGYIPQFSEDIFKVYRLIEDHPPAYKLTIETKNGEEIVLGSFYTEQLVLWIPK
jgi:transposase InsO family protein